MIRRRHWTQAESGIALFEVLVCVVLLSAGLLLVYRPLLNSAGYLLDAQRRLVANRLVENQLWTFEEKAGRMNVIPEDIRDKKITSDGIVFLLGVHAFPISAEDKLYRVRATASWQTGAKYRSLQRVIYVNLV